jgi:hypothetical protein
VILRNLSLWKQEGKLSSITSAYKWSICIFQPWYRELLLKDECDDDMKIFDLDWSSMTTSAMSTRKIRLQLYPHQQYP